MNMQLGVSLGTFSVSGSPRRVSCPGNVPTQQERGLREALHATPCLVWEAAVLGEVESIRTFVRLALVPGSLPMNAGWVLGESSFPRALPGVLFSRSSFSLMKGNHFLFRNFHYLGVIARVISPHWFSARPPRLTSQKLKMKYSIRAVN